MATDAHGTFLRVSAANTRGSRPARAPLEVILVCELAAAMKQPNELVKPTMPMNQENQGVKCRDRSRNGATSPPSTLIPATGPFQSAKPGDGCPARQHVQDGDHQDRGEDRDRDVPPRVPGFLREGAGVLPADEAGDRQGEGEPDEPLEAAGRASGGVERRAE